MNQDQEASDDLELESKVHTFEVAVRKLRRLVNDSPDFPRFKERLQSFMGFYLGDPMPEPLRRWTWAEFQKFYEDNKGR